jgi:hypothetical protein
MAIIRAADRDRVEKRLIWGKPIYVFETHNVALLAWADIRASRSGELLLLSLDHHTDTREAFVVSAYPAPTGVLRVSQEEHLARIRERVGRVDLGDQQSLREAVADLRNDEHIDAAIRLKMFRLAFCFNQQYKNTRSVEEDRYAKNHHAFGAEPPRPPFSYVVPANGIFTVSEVCFRGCTRMPHDERCHRPFANQAVESIMLTALITRANSMAGSAGVADITSSDFVLDIDLDYFRTIDSLSPSDRTIFHDLIRKAVAVTIATEPLFVEELKLDDHLTSDYALTRVVEHVEAALAPL